MCKITKIFLVITAITYFGMGNAFATPEEDLARRFSDRIKAMVQQQLNNSSYFDSMCRTVYELFDLQEIHNALVYHRAGASSYRVEVGYIVSLMLSETRFFQNLRDNAGNLGFFLLGQGRGPGGSQSITFTMRQGADASKHTRLFIRNGKIVNIAAETGNGDMLGTGLANRLNSLRGSTTDDALRTLINRNVPQLNSYLRDGCP